MPDRLERQAHAKVNLTLRITGRRPDGYHSLESVMQTVELADELELVRAPEISLECDHPAVPLGADNLVVRAAWVLREHWGCRQGAHIRLRKRIPLQAGLGGGSADAAAALLALSELWELGAGPADLLPLAAELGSDVGFFLFGGTAVVAGAGEQVGPATGSPMPLHLVLAQPEGGLSTAAVYRRYDELAVPVSRDDSAAAMLAALERGDLAGIAAALANDLERAVLPDHPPVAALKRALREAGCPGALLCGSGSAVFGLCRGPEQAREVLERLRSLSWRAHTLTWPGERSRPAGGEQGEQAQGGG